MSTSFIDAKEPSKIDPDEQETVSILLYIGIFFDGVFSSVPLSKELSQYYSPEVNNNNEKKYTIIASDYSGRTFTKANSDQDEDEMYANALSSQVSSVLTTANTILNVYLSKAENLKIIIDTFAIDDGAVSAALFCNSIEPGKIQGNHRIVERVMADIEGGGIFGDLKLKGANIELNSFTHFDSSTLYDDKKELKNSNDKEQDDQSHYDSASASNEQQSYSESNTNESPLVLKGYVSYDRVIEDSQIRPTYISADKRNPILRFINNWEAKRYTTMYGLRKWIDEKAYQIGILSILSIESIEGAPVGVAMELICMCLNAASTMISINMAQMTIRNKRDRTDNLKKAGTSAIGIIPWGRILGSLASKGFSFVLKQFSKRPNLKLIIGGGGNTPPTTPTTKPNLRLIKGGLDPASPTSPDSNVIPFRRPVYEDVLHVSNGSDITIPSYNNSSLTIVNQIPRTGTNKINNIYIPQTSLGSGSIPKVDPINSIFNSSNSGKGFADQLEQINKIKDAELEKAIELLKKVNNGTATEQEIRKLEILRSKFFK